MPLDPAVEAELEALLAPFIPARVELGLERIEDLLARLGNPQQQVPFVHVAGSNGKGSVCAYLSTVLCEAGYRVGRYISPHLVSWCERISVDLQPIEAEVFRQLLERAIAAADPDNPPTVFELSTAVAWLYFAALPVDIAVIEVGLGGRLDATNVAVPLVGAIVSISREHWQVLGPTLADIAAEKAGILKPGFPAVVGPLPAEAMAVVEQKATALGCPLHRVEAATLEGDDWCFEGLRYRSGLVGEIQRTNSAIALAALRILEQQGWLIPEASLRQGLAKTQWPGRLQWLTYRGRKILVDGAHNSAAAQVLRAYVDSLGTGPVTWVLGMLANKDHQEVFEALLRRGDRLAVVPVPGHSSADPERLTALASQVCPHLAAKIPLGSWRLALAWAMEQTSANQVLVFCGSLYLLGEFFKEIDP
jgi:dihydrofolate synthase / folylpolyglutamate synthase